MRVIEIAKMPTSITKPLMKELASGSCTGIHESMLRSWHILERVKDYLRKDTPADVILELIEVMEKAL